MATDDRDRWELKTAIDAEIASLIDDDGETSETFDFAAWSERLEGELQTKGVDAWDPPDEVYLRAVVAELRRRAYKAV